MKDRFRSYHEGELAVQARAGVGSDGLFAEEMYRPLMPAGVQRFLSAQQVAVLASMDSEGRVWASMRSGQPGFLRALNEQTVEIGGYGHPEDPLLENLAQPSPAGVLVIHLGARQRIRLNGIAQADQAGLIRLNVNQVYGNCPKYIQAREVKGERELSQGTARHTAQLDARLQHWLEGADTFFLATAHPQSGLDASHRGGKPGFVRVENQRQLLFPDYPGNKMFNSLGNIVSYPKAGLLFPDFETGAVVQISGNARILWDDLRITEFKGAQRLVVVDIERVIELPSAVLLRLEFRNYSPDLR